ncbi:MAG TPA: porin [Myxococcota bacterium]|nr:porin [Myxococcota bacterium]HRY94510.1 porin [Myxococcota bacterium]HSA21579.1 porin [Myxococcota bacterium]
MARWLGGFLVVALSVAWTAPGWAEEPAADAEPAFGYDKGFFVRSADGDHLLRLNVRAHTLFSLQSLDGADGRDQEFNFAISVARLMFTGHLMGPELEFRFEVDFAKGTMVLLDVYANYAFLPRVLELRVGLMKRPFARQFLHSSGRYQMVDRSFANTFFGEGYDLGLMLHDGCERAGLLEWSVGVWNGSNADKPWLEGRVDLETGEILSGAFTNVPDELHPLLVARLGLNLGAVEPYTETDFEGGGPRLGLGASLILDPDADGGEDAAVRAELDYQLKAYGFSLGGAFFVSARQRAAGAGGETGFADQELAASGAYLQAGYLIAERVEPIVRYTLVVPEGRKSAQEAAAAVSVYFHKHAFKWQTQYAARVNPGVLSGQDPGADDRLDHRVLSQLVWAF